MPRIALVIGSKSDEELGNQIVEYLKKFGVECDYRILSAHRNPEELDAFVKKSDAELFITVAGLSAALPGAIASRTIRPVIGVPKEVKLGGLDALLSMVQMPPGVPVAAVGIDNWRNAAILALEILALKHPELETRLMEERGMR
ncbi:MAG: 5-(carboxyamino)imidazole ribonucleotide mutase [Thermoproteota archaeon]